MKSIRNNVTLTGQKNLTARQRASHFKSKDHAAAATNSFLRLTGAELINAWGMRAIRPEELLGRNTYLLSNVGECREIWEQIHILPKLNPSLQGMSCWVLGVDQPNRCLYSMCIQHAFRWWVSATLGRLPSWTRLSESWTCWRASNNVEAASTIYRFSLEQS